MPNCLFTGPIADVAEINHDPDAIHLVYNLAAKMQMTRSAIQNGIEVYLQKLNLIEVTQNGRRLTDEGKDIFK